MAGDMPGQYRVGIYKGRIASWDCVALRLFLKCFQPDVCCERTGTWMQKRVCMYKNMYLNYSRAVSLSRRATSMRPFRNTPSVCKSSCLPTSQRYERDTHQYQES